MKRIFTFLALAMTVLLNVSAQEGTVIFEADYTTWESYPYYKLDAGACNSITFDAEDGLVYVFPGAEDGCYRQFFIADGLTMKAGYKYLIDCEIQSSSAQSFGFNMGSWSKSASSNLASTTAWSHAKAEITLDSDQQSVHITMQPWNWDGTIKIRSLVVRELAVAKTKDGDKVNLAAEVWGKTYPASSASKVDANSGDEFVVSSPAKVSQDWDSQAWILLPAELPNGTVIHLSFDYKADAAATVNTQSHNTPGSYLHWSCIGDVNFTTEWQTFDQDVTVSGECNNKFRSVAFNLTKATENTFYFRNIKVTAPGHDPIDVTVTSAGWATLYTDFNAYIPDGVDVYYVDGQKNENYVSLKKVEDVIPAGSGVLINTGEAMACTFTYCDTAQDALSGNLLKGVTEDTKVTAPSGYVDYLLYVSGGEPFFGLYDTASENKLGANKAYLELPATTESKIFIDLSEVTEIESAPAAEAETSGGMYNLAGQIVGKDYKGIVIVNGKKMLVK